MENDTVKISIRDTGVGIPAEHLSKIFDPGFTTKGVGVGTGLGLSISYKIIQDHHGTIEAESLKDETMFVISIPLTAPERPRMSDTAEWIPNILLVDDEEIVLSSLKSFFALDTNCNLMAYTSPLNALESLDRGESRIDLVISDYLMPEMDGITFLAKVKEKLPMVPRILLTGYADKENAIEAINNDVGLYQYVEKPWDNEDLKLIIRNGLEKTTAPSTRGTNSGGQTGPTRTGSRSERYSPRLRLIVRQVPWL